LATRLPSLLLAGVLSGAATTPAAAQHDVVEINAAVGYATAEGLPPPDLPVVGAGVTVWPAERWGVGWSMSYGPGEEDRVTSSGQPATFGTLMLHRAVVYYRHAFSESLSAAVGGGALVRGSYDAVVFTGSTSGHSRSVEESWSGFSIDAVLRARIVPHLSIQPGVLIDFALDRLYYQPVIRVAVGF